MGVAFLYVESGCVSRYLHGDACRVTPADYVSLCAVVMGIAVGFLIGANS
jgi:hypothetical protein